VATYVETHLHVNIMNHPLLETEPLKAMTESFMKTNDELKEHTDRLCLSSTTGSTAVTILIKGKKMYVAWVGDSLACMFMKKSHVELVDPHKPASPVSSRNHATNRISMLHIDRKGSY
jgi:serine/threonine protein phosphatase PrpC